MYAYFFKTITGYKITFMLCRASLMFHNMIYLTEAGVMHEAGYVYFIVSTN